MELNGNLGKHGKHVDCWRVSEELRCENNMLMWWEKWKDEIYCKCSHLELLHKVKECVADSEGLISYFWTRVAPCSWFIY